MVREIIALQVGQCGNQIGTAFWETILAEHNLGSDGVFIPSNDNNCHVDNLKKAKLNVYFNESTSTRYIPRSILIDLEPGVLDTLKSKSIGSIFKPDNFIFGISGGANNWAKSHFQEGPEMIDEICDVIRKEVESCDCLQGFQVTQSLGGGTGSGLGSLILLKLREIYSDRIISTFSIFPSPKISDVVVEPYNTILSLPLLMEDCDNCTIIDNEALYTISKNILKQEHPKYADLNWIISLVMSGITSSLRFPGNLNSDLRKLSVNLVPFPRLHFFLTAYAPLFAKPSHISHIKKNDEKYVKLSMKEIMDQLWSGHNFLANINVSDGKYLSSSCIYRGLNLKMYEVEDETAKIQDKCMEDFVIWIPNNIMTSVVNIPSNLSLISGSFLANFTGINHVFKRISAAFSKMYKRKAFLHWYLDVGMDSAEIEESDKNVQDLIQEYQDKCDVIVDPNDPFGNNINNEDEQIIGDESDEEYEKKEYDSDGIIKEEDEQKNE